MPRRIPTPEGGPMYRPGRGCTKPLAALSDAELRQYHREKKRAQREGAKSPSRLLVRRDVGPAIADPTTDPRALVPLATLVTLSTRQRLANASCALLAQTQDKPWNRVWTQRSMVERALVALLDEIEEQHNNSLPFADPPESCTTSITARSRRTRDARQKPHP